VQTGDVVTHIDGTPLAEWSMAQVRSACIGTAGTSVRLTIDKADGRTLDVTLVIFDFIGILFQDLIFRHIASVPSLFERNSNNHGFYFDSDSSFSGARQPGVLALSRLGSGSTTSQTTTSPTHEHAITIFDDHHHTYVFF
jgi:hypothetical protein